MDTRCGWSTLTMRPSFEFGAPTAATIFAERPKLTHASSLACRHPEGDEELVYIFDQDDPYFNQMTAFVDRADSARRGGNNGIEGAAEILSSYEDAAKTYAL